MKALLFTLDFPPVGGGISRYNEGLARFWPPGELSVLAPDVPGARETDARLPCPVFRRPYFARLPTPHPARAMPAALRAIRGVMAEVRPDLILCGQPLTTGLAGELVAGTRPVVLFVHGEELRRHRDSMVSRAILRRVLRRAARVVVVSEYGRGETRGYGVREDRILKVTGILPEFLAEDAPALPPALAGELGDRPVVLSVGRLEVRKGQDLVIEAIARMTGGDRVPVAVLVGEGEEHARLEARALALGVRERVFFTGRVTEDALRALYRRADLLVLPARAGGTGEEEGLGLVFIEAAAVGTPAIGTRVGGIPDALVEGRTGLLVAPDSIDELAAAIGSLLGDRDRLRSMGARARERARREYDWRVNAPELREMLVRCVAGP